MKEFAERLCADGHYEAVEIQQRRRDVLHRRSKVKDLASERRSMLEDCRKLMVFLQNCTEVSGNYSIVCMIQCTSNPRYTS